MAFKVIWSPEALGDLKDICDYIAVDSPDAAEGVGLAIIEKAENLSEYPQLGHMVPELQEVAIRETLSQPYRTIYRVELPNRTVEILRIWHGARDKPEIPT